MPRTCLFSLLLIALAFGHTTSAFSPEKRLTQYQLEQWNVDDGLPQNSVRGLARTQQGYLLVGTYEGLALFDGVRFQSFPGQSSPALEKNTTQIAAGKDGSLWIGGRDTGLHRFSPPNPMQPTGFHAPDRNYHVEWWGTEQGLPSQHISALHVDAEGAVWVGTRAGLVLMRDGQALALPDSPFADAPITAIDSHGSRVYVAAAGVGLFLRDEGEPWQAMQAPGSQAAVNALSVHQDYLIVGTDAGALRFSLNGQWLGELSMPRQFQGEPISSLLSNEQQLFIGTYGRGLVRWSNQVVERFSSAQGLGNDYIQSLLLDAEGTLWIGSSGGLHRLNDAPLTSISTPEGLSHGFVRTVTEDQQGDLWVGVDGTESGDGLNRISRDGNISQLGSDMGVPGNTVRAMSLDSEGTLWLAAYGDGLAYLDPVTGQFVRPAWNDQLPSLRNRALLFDQNHTLWIATDDHGVVQRNRQGQLRSLRRANGFPSDSINALAEAADGGIWMASYGDGLIRWRAGDIDHWQEADGLPSNTVMHLHIDADQRIWLGTDRGLAFIQDDRVVTANPNGAPWSGALFQIIDDQAGRLWLCGNQGIISVDRQALLQQPDQLPDYRRFGRAEGLRSLQCNGGNQPGVWQREDDWLWFSTADGLVGAHPPTLRDSPALGAVVIESVVVDGRALELGPTGVLRLPNTAGRLEVRYSAPTSIAADRVEFRYRLLGYDRAWNQAMGNRNAQYTRLPAGEYTLEVQARRPGADWQPSQASSLSLQRPPRATETTAFALILAALLVLLAFYLYKLRVRQLRRRARTLEQHVRERTSELEAAVVKLSETRNRLVQAEKLASMTRMLAGISHELNTPLGNAMVVNSRLQEHCRALRQLLDEPQPSRCAAGAELDRIDLGLELMGNGLQQSSQLIRRFRDSASPASTLGPENFDLTAHLQAFAETSNDRDRRPGKSRLSIDAPATLPMFNHPESLREVLNELTDNSVRHGLATDIRLSVEHVDETQVALVYQDNGEGITQPLRHKIFDPLNQSMSGKQGSGLGMHRVFSLVTGILGGEIELIDSNNQGAAFRIILPRQLDAPAND